MTTPRLKSELWVKAYIRRCMAADAPAVVARRGFEDAGAILLRVNRLDGTAQVYARTSAPDGGQAWLAATGAGPVPDAEADAYVARAVRTDPDLWVVEVEDRQGRHFLDDPFL